MNKNSIKLNNISLPLWFPLWFVLLVYPTTWIVVVPVKLLLDLFVVYLTMISLELQDIKTKLKSVIYKVWIFGFIGDFIGVGLIYYLINVSLFNNNLQLEKWWWSIQELIKTNPFGNIFALLLVTTCVIVSAISIYLFNYKICLKKLDLTNKQKKKIALSLAIFTAPYLLYFP